MKLIFFNLWNFKKYDICFVLFEIDYPQHERILQVVIFNFAIQFNWRKSE